MKRVLSDDAFGALRHIAENPIPVDNLGFYDDTTLHALFQHHEIAAVYDAKRKGYFIRVTGEGAEILGRYENARIPERMHAAPVTDRTAAHLPKIVQSKVG